MARKKPVKNNSDSYREEGKKTEQNSSGNDFILKKIDWSWVTLGIIGFIVFIIRLKFLNIPFERDEGTYAYFGQLILDGKIPYIDFYEMKYPGIYYSYALLLMIFGQSLSSIHFAFILLNLATIFFLYGFSAKLFSKTTGVITAAAYALLSLIPHVSGFTIQSEHLVNFYFAAGLYFFALSVDKGKIAQFFLSGIFIGMSFMVKQNGVFFILFVGISIVLYHLLQKVKDWKKLLINAASYSVGVFVPFVLFSLLMVFMGSFKEYWYFTFEFPQLYIEEFDPEQGKQLLKYVFGKVTEKNQLMWWVAASGMITVFFTSWTWSKKIMVWLLALISFVAITPGLRFYGHYWLMMMPGVAVLAGVAVHSLSEILANFKLNKSFSVGVPVGIFVLAILMNFSKDKEYYLKPDYTKILREVYGTNPFPESKIIGDYVKSHTTESDEIAVLGSEPQIYFYTDRRCPSKHSYTTWLVNANGAPEHAIWQKEFIADVEKAMPKYLVFFNHPISWLVHPNADKTIFTWFNEFSQKNYKPVGIADMLAANNTNYVWDEAVLSYKPQGQYYIWVFERLKSQ